VVHPFGTFLLSFHQLLIISLGPCFNSATFKITAFGDGVKASAIDEPPLGAYFLGTTVPFGHTSYTSAVSGIWGRLCGTGQVSGVQSQCGMPYKDLKADGGDSCCLSPEEAEHYVFRWLSALSSVVRITVSLPEGHTRTDIRGPFQACLQ
jgi:hypothetical protein